MRPHALMLVVLLVQQSAQAQDHFSTHLKVFEDARAVTLEPGAQARVHPALEALVATGDVRAVGPLASYLIDTMRLEQQVKVAARKTQQTAVLVHKRLQVLDKELNFLRLKEKAGDRTVGPEIQKREEEKQRKTRLFDRQKASVSRSDQVLGFVRDLRAKIADGCAKVLSGLKDGKAEAGLSRLQSELDIGTREQALFIVRIISDSRVAQAEDHLVDILAHPKLDSAVVRATQLALGSCLTRKGAEALIRSWERDPEGAGVTARHVLSLAAKRNLADLEEARAWTAKLQ